MSLFIDTTQGAGIAAGTGIRPFLPPLLVGALARADAGIDFEGTDYSFLEKPGFLVVVLGLAVVSYLASRSPAADAPDGGRSSLERGLLFVAVVLGALMCAGSVEHGGGAGWIGLLIGAGAAALGWFASAAFFSGARRRLKGSGASSSITLYADAASLAVAGLSVLFGPLALLFLAGLAYLLVSSRRKDDQKYAGLRILK
ncbi:MAG: DUF4126 family protein [Thermoleophilaceae bacterium]|nr:DUF4126 family protein [Thermoleophilaceae bacterium]